MVKVGTSKVGRMALIHVQNKRDFTLIEEKNSRGMPIPRPTLASIESLAIPLVSSLL